MYIYFYNRDAYLTSLYDPTDRLVLQKAERVATLRAFPRRPQLRQHQRLHRPHSEEVQPEPVADHFRIAEQHHRL